MLCIIHLLTVQLYMTSCDQARGRRCHLGDAAPLTSVLRVECGAARSALCGGMSMGKVNKLDRIVCILLRRVGLKFGGSGLVRGRADEEELGVPESPEDASVAGHDHMTRVLMECESIFVLGGD